MGTTLENGVYLPSEGERNCYAGLKTNWEILDQKVADVTALQQAVAGALHREIVESLPTTDIDPNTIYMVLSGTSATENVYNEFMYVNNAWELIGTSATDLTNYYTKAEVDGKLLLKANDSDVVHKSGNETVGGKKTFSDDLTIYNKDSSQNTKNLNISSSKIQVGDTSNSDAFGVRFNAGANFVAQILAVNDTTGTQNLQLSVRTKDNSDNFITSMVRSRVATNGNSSFESGANDSTSLGSSSFKWKGVYATNYYYGSNNVEFSDKFVTTDTAQTISGAKTFSDNISTKKIISNVAQLQINARSSADSVAIIAGANASDGSGIWLYGKDNATGSDCRIQIYNTAKSRYERVDLVNSQFLPTPSGELDCGGTSNKWKSFNGLEPSSLSLPNFSNRIDISSYVTNLNGAYNAYTPSVNGWIAIQSSDATFIRIADTGSGGAGNTTTSQNAGSLTCMMPVIANRQCNVYIKCTTLTSAYFIPCQGNV